MRLGSLGLTIALCPLLAGCQTSSATKTMPHLHGRPAPGFELKDIDGNAVSLASLRGRPVVLAFFAYG